MIVYYNVCDFCGNQNHAKEGDNQIRISFDIMPVTEYVKKGSGFGRKENSKTFCDRDCMTSFFQDFVKINGELVKREGDTEE